MRLEIGQRSRSLSAKFGAREETWRCTECGGPRMITDRAQTLGFRPILGDVLKSRDWMVDDAVRFELLFPSTG